MPLRAEFPHLPAIPVDRAGALDTLTRLAIRGEQATQAKQGLTHKFTIDGKTRTAYAFLNRGEGLTAPLKDARDALAKSLQEQPARAPTILAQRLRRKDHAVASTQPLSLEAPEQFSISWTSFPDVYELGRPLRRPGRHR